MFVRAGVVQQYRFRADKRAGFYIFSAATNRQSRRSFCTIFLLISLQIWLSTIFLALYCGFSYLIFQAQTLAITKPSKQNCHSDRSEPTLLLQLRSCPRRSCRLAKWRNLSSISRGASQNVVTNGPRYSTIAATQSPFPALNTPGCLIESVAAAPVINRAPRLNVKYSNPH